VLPQWAHTISMHPSRRLENESKSGAISVHLFLPRPLRLRRYFNLERGGSRRYYCIGGDSPLSISHQKEDQK
jgi:hypothetical protein